MREGVMREDGGVKENLVYDLSDDQMRPAFTLAEKGGIANLV
jgi:hypothetical protein